MTKPGADKLSDEDRIIWTKVARTARPLKGKPPLPADEPQADDRAALEVLLDEKAPPVASPRAKLPERKSRPLQHQFDQQTRDKLAKGRLQIDARVDLHGMTQGEAHGLLLSFLRRAHAGGLRYVLVITGKGASFGSEGVLKRADTGLAQTSLRPAAARDDVGGTSSRAPRPRRGGRRSVPEAFSRKEVDIDGAGSFQGS